MGGHHVNAPLSMHSEMMAIQSALSLSSGAQSYQTSAHSAAKWSQKLCFKLLGASKRKARFRGLKAYVQAMCAEPTADAFADKQSSGKFSHQESRFEAYPSQSGQGGSEMGQWGRGERERCGEANEEEKRETTNEE